MELSHVVKGMYKKMTPSGSSDWEVALGRLLRC